MPAARRPACLRAEPLEGREVPAVFTVTTLADGGARDPYTGAVSGAPPGSLRDAIDRANAAPDPDTVVFAPAVRGGAVGLTTSHNYPFYLNPAVPQPAGPSAFVITSPVTIQGTGETITRAAGGEYRLFQVTRAGSLTLSGLTLSNGLARGGAGGGGGGGGAGLGGAVYNQGTLTVLNSTLTGNQAVGGAATPNGSGNGGGLGLPNPPSNPYGSGFGIGGISGADPWFGGTGGIGGFGGGGGGYPPGWVGMASTAGPGGFGGGGGGGTPPGLSVSGTFGGMGGSGFNLVGPAPGGGGAGLGGAVFNQGGAVAVANSTLAGNTARGGDALASPGALAGMPGGGFGGGVFNLNGTVTLTNATVAGNPVADGASGGLRRVGVFAGGSGAVYNAAVRVGRDITPTSAATVVMANSIISAAGGGAAVVNDQQGGTAAVRAAGPNLVFGGRGGGGAYPGVPFTAADPLLGPLRNNGGYTPTMLPGAGSPALGAGDPAAAAAAGLATDQRGPGFARVVGGAVDLGAAEAQAGGPLAVGSEAGQTQLFAPAVGGVFAAAPAAALSPFPGFAGVVRSAAADVDGDGTPDTVLVTGPGTPTRAAVVSGADHRTLLVPPHAPFAGSEGFAGGGFVAAADLDGDGKAEWAVAPDRGGGPRVAVFARNPDGSAAPRASFLGVDDPAFRGGARVALGDVDGDGTPDLAVAAGHGGGPRAAVWHGRSVLGGAPARVVNDFLAFDGPDAGALRDGVFVAAGDLDGDGHAELVFGGGPGGAPRVLALSGELVAGGDVAGARARPVSNFFVAGNASDRGGVRVGVADADADGRADLVAGSGAGSPARVRVYLGRDLASAAEPAAFQDLAPFGGAALADGVYVG